MDGEGITRDDLAYPSRVGADQYSLCRVAAGMTDEHKLIQAVGDAARAETLMRDEFLMGVFSQLENDYIAGWRATAARDTDARERLWQAVQVVGKVRDHLGMVAANGRVAQAELDKLAGMVQKGNT